MAPEPSVFLCRSCKAKLSAGKKRDTATCSNCGTEVDVAALKSRIAETWNALQQEADQLQVRFVPISSFFHFPVQSWRPIKDLEEGFISFTSQYSQLLDLVSHPCRLLYKVVFLHKNAISCCHLCISPLSGRAVFLEGSKKSKRKQELYAPGEKHMCG